MIKTKKHDEENKGGDMFGQNEKEQKRTATKSDQVNGLLDKGCSFEGKLTFDGTVQINGDFQGEIFSDGTLVVGNDARVNAKIIVDTLVSYGRVEGNIEAKSRVELHVPAVVVANINTKSLSIEDGVIYEGQCHMEHENITTQKAGTEGDYSQRENTEESEDVLVM